MTTMFFPTLYIKSKTKKNKFWKIYVKGNCIFRESWFEEGVVQSFPVVECKGKNQNKTNATTDEEQAKSEAKSKWTKQFDKGYTVYDQTDVELKSKTSQLLPMLAQKFTERQQHISLPCGVSRKFDGVRMLARLENGKVKLTSRTCKEFMWMDRLRTQISHIFEKFEVVLDGELYAHDLSFSVLCGSIRSLKKPSVYDDKLEYWIFDIADENQSYSNRMKILTIIKNWYEIQHPNINDRCIKFELYELVNNLCDIQSYHDKYVNEGFEGLIIRNMNGLYTFKHRSNDLQKYKNFEDAEFEIVGYKTGVGSEKDAIIYICKDSKSQLTFDVRPRGSIYERIQKAKVGNTLVGKKLIVRFQPPVKSQDIDKNELPRFPVGIEIRDYE